MVDYCANPQCLKPLHYLREGTIYVFDVPDGEPENGSKYNYRLEHYWLCGTCSATHMLERTATKELLMTPKRAMRHSRKPVAISETSVSRSAPAIDRALAS